ncbi:Na+/H+ antiporter [Paecilomyces lecythidis]
MAWDHLSIDKPHVAYIILGGFTSLFMLCSLFVKEKLYIGEATVATICGIIFGPHAADLFNPASWGNVDKITLECSRIVLVVQCFAVGVELPKAYMERHWRSVVLLLLPVMTWGWFATSLFVWWMIPPLNWLESLACAACVTATDPVLASSVVGKGKFAKRVPKHLRDLLSAESGCNDGMAFPFIYLSVYLIKFHRNAGEVTLNWICVTILYECIFGAVYGFIVGYIARHAIKTAERHNLIDRESFLVFYFVLALFCAGTGSLLGMDDLLIGFAAGVGFSNDGWFTEKTEEAHVSNVIDLLLNLAYFVYFGSIVPWEYYNSPELGVVPWRLVVIAILVIFFRRIPAMLMLKPIIPDIKTWREALFAGHFGPIGVGAVFASILARAELEGADTEPLPQSELPRPGTSNYYVVQLIWPITSFLIISSILVHGSSIAVFTLGKRINTLTITMSYTTANEEGPSWMNRLPRVQSMSKSSMSLRKADSSELSGDEKEPEYPPGTLPPIGFPGNFLRRVREEDQEAEARPANLRPLRRRKRRRRTTAGGPISDTAIAPRRRPENEDTETEEQQEADKGPETEEDEDVPRQEKEERENIERESSPPTRERDRFGHEPEIEVYREGSKMIIEDEEGNVLKTEDVSHESPEQQKQSILEEGRKLQQEKSGEHAKSKGQPHEKTEGEEIEEKVADKTGHPYAKLKKQLFPWAGRDKEEKKKKKEAPTKPKGKGEPSGAGRRSAHAYQFGNTIIVEDEDGEVIKKYTIPAEKPGKKEEATAAGAAEGTVRRGLTRMGTWLGEKDGESSKDAQKKAKKQEDEDDTRLRFTLAADDHVEEKGVGHKGRRMTKDDFIKQIQRLDPKARCEVVEDSDAPDHVKKAARKDAHDDRRRRRESESRSPEKQPARAPTKEEATQIPADYESGDESGESDLTDASSDEQSPPSTDVMASLAKYSRGSAAHARRRVFTGDESSSSSPSISGRRRRDSEDDGTARVPPAQRRQAAGLPPPAIPRADDLEDNRETPAERKRRLAALGEIHDPADDVEEELDSEDNGGFRKVKGKVQFADGTRPSRRKEGAGAVSSGTDPGSHAAASGGLSDENGSPETSSSNGNGDSSNGSPSSPRPSHQRHRPRVSWGGELGRE